MRCEMDITNVWTNLSDDTCYGRYVCNFFGSYKVDIMLYHPDEKKLDDLYNRINLLLKEVSSDE